MTIDSSLNATKLTGTIPTANIPTNYLTSSSNLDATKLTGTIPTGNLPSFDYLSSRTYLGNFSWAGDVTGGYSLPSYGMYLFSTNGNNDNKRVICYVNHSTWNSFEFFYIKQPNYYNRYWNLSGSGNIFYFQAWFGSTSVSDGQLDSSNYDAYIIRLINY